MRRLTREELYALVWARPMTKVAKQFGLSDVALHKICSKHDVPTPPQGYWAKKEFGKPVTVRPLSSKMRPASTVLPKPTSSAIKRFTRGSRSALRSGSNWYGSRRMPARNGA